MTIAFIILAVVVLATIVFVLATIVFVLVQRRAKGQAWVLRVQAVEHRADA